LFWFEPKNYFVSFEYTLDPVLCPSSTGWRRREELARYTEKTCSLDPVLFGAFSEIRILGSGALARYRKNRVLWIQYFLVPIQISRILGSGI
jgi:hypothetical protein